jgi:glycosyltransferase involved in cell wall biosynthesis
MPSAGRSLRVLTVSHNYPRFPGDPAGSFVARIAEGVASRGHKVEVVVPHAPGISTEETLGGVRVHRFRYAPEALERVAYTGDLHGRTLFSPAAAIGFPGFLVAFSRAIRRAVKRFVPDVIHAHWWLPGGWFARNRGVPLVITCHGSDVRLLARGNLFPRIARSVLRSAGRITTASNFLADDIRQRLPGLQTPVLVTPMPVDTMSFLAGARVPKVNPARLLYAGNLVPSKGVDVLLQAVGELERRGLRWELRVLGQGPAMSALQRQATELGVSSKISWASFVPQSQMPEEYGASTVTVLPSRGQAEGLGLTLVEALLAGSAVVGTAAGGIPEVIQHERTGLIARDGDAIDLAAQLERLLTDDALRQRLTDTGREQVLRNYAPEAAIDRFLDAYHAVAAR